MPPDDTRTRQLTRRVRDLETQLAGTREVTGVCTAAPELIVPLLSSVYGSDGRFVIRFSSVPEKFYQVQTSADMITWTVVAGSGAVPAHATLPYTDWTSAVVAFDDLPVYFRVRRHPEAVMACVPSAPSCP